VGSGQAAPAGPRGRTPFDDREFHVHVPAGAIPKVARAVSLSIIAALRFDGAAEEWHGHAWEFTCRSRISRLWGDLVALYAHSSTRDSATTPDGR
jgi:hypothetical protein